MAGVAFMRPGRKKVAGETLPVALTPPQPVENTATAMQAAAEAKRTERALFMGASIREGVECRNRQVGGPRKAAHGHRPRRCPTLGAWLSPC